MSKTLSVTEEKFKILTLAIDAATVAIDAVQKQVDIQSEEIGQQALKIKQLEEALSKQGIKL